MMPDNELSTDPVLSAFLPPADRAFDAARDYELGGIAHQDPSRGLQHQVWTAWADESGLIQIQPEDGSQPAIAVATAPGATYISLAFDRNMNMAVAWAVGGDVLLRWFDSTIEAYATTTFPGLRCPRLTHDDKRDGAGQWSDVILAYQRDGALYVRQQRDRYSIERLLSVTTDGDLQRLGMTRALRVKFEAY